MRSIHPFRLGIAQKNDVTPRPHLIPKADLRTILPIYRKELRVFMGYLSVELSRKVIDIPDHSAGNLPGSYENIRNPAGACSDGKIAVSGPGPGKLPDEPRAPPSSTAAADCRIRSQCNGAPSGPGLLCGRDARSSRPLWLAAAFLVPNLGALACGFVFDDRVLIVQNDSLHVQSLRQLAHIWKSGYWPDNRGLELYRPVAQTVWALAWAAGGGSHPALFHAIGLALGLAVVLLALPLLARRRNAAAHRVRCSHAVRAFPDPHGRHYVGGRLGGADGRGPRSGRADFLLSRPAGSGADPVCPCRFLQGERCRLRRASAGFPASGCSSARFPAYRRRSRGHYRRCARGAPGSLAQLSNPSDR